MNMLIILFLSMSGVAFAEVNPESQKQKANSILKALREKHGTVIQCTVAPENLSKEQEVELTIEEKKEEKVAPIADNSFFIEEGYNQPKGVSQTVLTFQQNHNKTWTSALTHEFPIGDVTHQGSFTVPFSHVNENGEATGLGDIFLNYRYNVGTGNEHVLFAPRLSLILPTGDSDKGLGTNAIGYQGNLPLTIELSDKWATHFNLGYTRIPDAKNTAGESENFSSWNYGGSIVYFINDDVNFLTEVFKTSSQTTQIDGSHSDEESCFVSPGVRVRKRNENSEWVYGIGKPIRIQGIDDPSDPKFLLYVSFEK